MQQPELGRRLTNLRKDKILTQQELLEKSHLRARTIQRIEAGVHDRGYEYVSRPESVQVTYLKEK